MPRIHYFQRYSSVENTVTNNTLLLLARIQNYSNQTASKLLSDLTKAEVEIGVSFTQQGRGENSVPDAQILQDSFRILIESKVDSGLNEKQLIAHCKTFKSESVKILVYLTKQKLSDTDIEALRVKILEESKDIIFRNLTYENICNTIKGLFMDHEPEMQELVEDYILYCHETDLLDKSKSLMRVVPCGASFEINKKHGVYFHTSNRGYAKHTYTGIYKNKSVRLFWKNDSVFDANYKNGKLTKILVEGENTDEFDDSIIGIIKDAKTECDYDITTGSRFFCTRNMLETDYKKTSRGGIQGHRLHDLSEIIPDLSIPHSEIAQTLERLEWG